MDGNLSASDVALMMGGRNDGGFGGGNVLVWLFALMLLGGLGGNGWGDNGYRPQYATQDFVQQGFNFNDLQDQNRDIMNAITGGTAQAVAATNQAKYDNINVIKDAQSAVMAQFGEVKQMEQSINSQASECCCAILRAIDGVNYQNAQNTNEIKAHMTDLFQKLYDQNTANRMAEMQNRINQLEMAQAMSGVVRYPNGWTYSAGPSPFCPNC